ncbi:MAG: hypothetical protein ABI852_21275 [Gemmatimonadaceae bacterium]
MKHHLRQLLVFRDSPVLTQCEVILPKAADRFDVSQILTDTSTRERVAKPPVELASWVRALNNR